MNAQLRGKVHAAMASTPRLWHDTRATVLNDLSDKQTLKCCCGRLATGLHEMQCVRFNEKVDRATLKQLGGK